MTTVMVGGGHVLSRVSAQHARLFLSLDLGLWTTCEIMSECCSTAPTLLHAEVCSRV